MLKLGHFVTVGAGTMVSRVLGFIRDIAIASALGAGPVADAFVVAFRLPNLVRRIFTEGALNAAFVPAYRRTLSEKGEAEASDFAHDVLVIATLAAGIAVALLMVASAWLVVVLAPGFPEGGERAELASAFLRLALPYVPLTLAFAVLAAILNAHNRFGAMAFAPNLLNLVMIAAVMPFARSGTAGAVKAGWALASAVSIGGLLQLLMTVVALKRAGLWLRWRRPRWHPDVTRLFRAAVPGVIASSVVQINTLVATIAASTSESVVSWLYYADRVYQLPLGIVSVAIGVVLLPAIADKTREGAHAEVNAALSRALEFGWLLVVPAAMALWVIAVPVCEVLFQRGAFGPRDAAGTAQLLAVIGLALPWLVTIKVLNNAFFARENTTLPMRATVTGIIVNGVLCWGLLKLMGPVGVAWASVISAVVTVLVLLFMLQAAAHFSVSRHSLGVLVRIIIAGAGMGLTLMGLERVLAPWLHGPATLKALALAALVIGGLVAYGALVLATGAARLSDISAMLGRDKSA